MMSSVWGRESQIRQVSTADSDGIGPGTDVRLGCESIKDVQG